jgi:hypothetical protein
MIPGVPIV